VPTCLEQDEQMEKQHIQLKKKERKQLAALLAKGQLAAKVFKRATALLELDRGKTMSAVAQTLGVSYPTVLAWRAKYQAQGLECLYDAPRSGRPPQLDGLQRAQITALACSAAPEGRARWSLRLLADKVVEAEFCETISHTQVRKILKKTNSNRTSSRLGASARSTRSS
jgi:putative transposase